MNTIKLQRISFLLVFSLCFFVGTVSAQCQSGQPGPGTPLYTKDAAANGGQASDTLLESDYENFGAIVLADTDVSGFKVIELANRDPQTAQYWYFKLEEATACETATAETAVPESQEENQVPTGPTEFEKFADTLLNKIPWIGLLGSLTLVVVVFYYIPKVVETYTKEKPGRTDLSDLRTMGEPIGQEVGAEWYYMLSEDPNRATFWVGDRELQQAWDTDIRNWVIENKQGVPVADIEELLITMFNDPFAKKEGATHTALKLRERGADLTRMTLNPFVPTASQQDSAELDREAGALIQAANYMVDNSNDDSLTVSKALDLITRWNQVENVNEAVKIAAENIPQIVAAVTSWIAGGER